MPGENGYLYMYNEILSYLYENKTTTRLLMMSPKEADMTKKICDDIYKLLTVFYLSKRQPISKEVLNVTALFSTYGILSIIGDWVNSDFKHPPQEMAEITFQVLFLCLMWRFTLSPYDVCRDRRCSPGRGPVPSRSSR